MEPDIIYVKKKTQPDGVEFVVPAVALTSRSGADRLIPHPFGNRSAAFSSEEETVEAIHRAGYAAEIDGQFYPLPDQTRRSKPQKARPPRHGANIFESVTPTLIDLLKDSTPNVVASAAYALGEMKTSEAIGPLQHCFAHDDNTVRKHVSEAMAKIGEPAMSAVRQALADRNYVVRLTAVMTVSEYLLHARPLGMTLLDEAKQLLADENWIVRSQAAHLIGQAAHLVFGDNDES